jgi:hypothetical protein
VIHQKKPIRLRKGEVATAPLGEVISSKKQSDSWLLYLAQVVNRQKFEFAENIGLPCP